MNKFKRYGKIIAIDTAAVLLFIIGAFVGILPGPGGIFFYIAGLGLLAINHEWAERWLNTFKVKGMNLKTIVFPNKKWVRNLYDALSAVVITISVFFYFNTTNRFASSAMIAVALIATGVFFTNRDRFESIAALFKRNHKKPKHKQL